MAMSMSMTLSVFVMVVMAATVTGFTQIKKTRPQSHETRQQSLLHQRHLPMSEAESWTRKL
uniref:G004_VD_Con-ikot-ikot_precursor_conopeptide n=1 Tax=Conus geographus TaxID=6491 RepID=X5I9W0_CONGE|nr:G004_VD_Con-ikot-ikot_precursor_conopeptide [Conus geographus]